jgi:alpha-mannosidase
MTLSGSSSLSSTHKLIEDTIEKLRSLCQQSVLESWRFLPDPEGTYSVDTLPDGDTLSIATLNARHHIPWERGKQPLWLYQRWQWPKTVQGYEVQGYRAKLALRWWANLAELYVNGTLIQTGDIFDCFTRLPLSDSVIPGEPITVALRLLSPGHDEGALVRSHLLFESPDANHPEPSFIADELAVLYRYLKQFAPDELEDFSQKLAVIDWGSISDRPQFQASLQTLRQQLLPWSPWIKQRQISCVGHAHLDLAWLWPIADTWDAAERTFQSVLSLQKDFPELTYTHSSPALFDWVETHRPDLFQQIQEQVKQGRWAIDAGLWVEPELNTIGGESIVRQILYGQRYCREKFGKVSEVAWLPDTFGFNWQLPQLLTQGEIRCFATQKLRWNDTNAFPHDWFWWEGLDGTRLRSLTLPLIGSDVEPIVMADYACLWEANTGIPQSLWLPGVGDHGGGPTRDMLEKARRWAESPLFPELTFGHVGDFVKQLAALIPGAKQSTKDEDATHFDPNDSSLPVWRDELYLELHRGCYTTHADQKWFNRRCEDVLYQAELFSSLAALISQHSYPKAEIEVAWKKVLFNQFHDILPGSSIPEVFADANQGWEEALQVGMEILRGALGAIASNLALPQPPQPDAIPLMLFNPVNWERSEVVSVEAPHEPQAGYRWQVQDVSGQQLSESVDSQTIHFRASAVPSVGYRLFWLVQAPASQTEPAPPPAHWILENSLLKIEIDPQTGDIASLFDKRHQREVLSGPGNQLQAFQDQGQYWDAWNIAPDYTDHPLPPAQLKSIQWLAWGSLRQRLQVVRQLNQSTFTQDYILDAHSPLLTIETIADWQETQVVLKANFPLTVRADEATYEIPFGAIARSTNSQTSQDTAKWEVPALRWADLSQADYGVSLLTDCKHGFDASPSQLRLTLLKAPLWPDPTADRGEHRFAYALYPHPGDWKQAQTAHYAHNFNLPLHTVTASLQQSQPQLDIGSAVSFLDLGDSNLILAAFKQAEDHPNQLILRCYEAYGQAGHLTLQSPLPINLAAPVNLLEDPQETPPGDPLKLASWQVASYKVIPNASEP